MQKLHSLGACQGAEGFETAMTVLAQQADENFIGDIVF